MFLGLGVNKYYNRTQQLTPKAKTLYKKLFKLKDTLIENKSVKKQILHIHKNPHLLSDLKNVNEPTMQFILSQLKNQKLKPRGRRFSIDDKIFALALYKQSGKAYRFLSRIFCLPSRSTLIALLNHIPFGCGINKHVFHHLKTRVAKLKEIDKYCSLIFDEISLEPGVQYNKQLDCIEGIVDYGTDHREIKFADHALVFMIRGLFKKWKQPICFFFCEGTTPFSVNN